MGTLKYKHWLMYVNRCIYLQNRVGLGEKGRNLHVMGKGMTTEPLFGTGFHCVLGIAVD